MAIEIGFAFAGALQVTLLGGYMPTAGALFDILDFTSHTGTFATLNLPSLSAVMAWDTSQLYTDGVLRVILPGDFNHDGIVDAADYVVWRNGLGTTYTQNDYGVWRAHFGSSLGSGSGSALPSAESLSAAVPEPTTLILMILAAAGWCLRRRRAA